MGVIKYRVCKHCGRSFPSSREYFKRIKDKESGKEVLSDICRECEKQIELETEWRDGKLLCHICGRYLDPSEFHSTGVNGAKYYARGGKDKRCRECKTKQNKEARGNYTSKKALEKVLQERWLGAKDRAEKKGIEFSITKEYLKELWDKQKGLCAISKIPMTFTLDKGRVYSNVSIDQIVPSKGYTESNIQLVCMAVNQFKSDLSMETILYICKNILDNYNSSNTK